MRRLGPVRTPRGREQRRRAHVRRSRPGPIPRLATSRRQERRWRSWHSIAGWSPARRCARCEKEWPRSVSCKRAQCFGSMNTVWPGNAEDTAPSMTLRRCERRSASGGAATTACVAGERRIHSRTATPRRSRHERGRGAGRGDRRGRRSRCPDRCRVRRGNVLTPASRWRRRRSRTMSSVPMRLVPSPMAVGTRLRAASRSPASHSRCTSETSSP